MFAFVIVVTLALELNDFQKQNICYYLLFIFNGKVLFVLCYTLVSLETTPRIKMSKYACSPTMKKITFLNTS